MRLASVNCTRLDQTTVKSSFVEFLPLEMTEQHTILVTRPWKLDLLFVMTGWPPTAVEKGGGRGLIGISTVSRTSLGGTIGTLRASIRAVGQTQMMAIMVREKEGQRERARRRPEERLSRAMQKPQGREWWSRAEQNPALGRRVGILGAPVGCRTGFCWGASQQDRTQDERCKFLRTVRLPEGGGGGSLGSGLRPPGHWHPTGPHWLGCIRGNLLGT